ncbi:MAG: type II toxin-antitoxin system HicA family toxin [Chloroflexi bacterium]|nr:type II toxin-antitoxin system HicA family toxin [Chloroflexota bacterium]
MLSSREVCRILILEGFVEIRQTGSHIIMQKKILQANGEQETISVVVPYRKELRRGTLSSIIRQSKLPKDLFS